MEAGTESFRCSRGPVSDPGIMAFVKAPGRTPIGATPFPARVTGAPVRHARGRAAAGRAALVIPLVLAAFAAIVAPGRPSAGEAVQAPLATESLLIDGAAAGSRLVVVGERGHVLVSTDGGGSWDQARVPVRALLTAVHMHDERTGWAVGHDAVILRTDDGGESWRLVHHAPEEELPLLDVWFRDARNGFAIGAYGYFLATRDGGETWTPRAISEDDFHLNALVSAGSRGKASQRLYIAAEAGVAYRSDDGGETWRELPSPYAGSWYGALALDGDALLLMGLRGHLFRSADAGETWSRVSTGTNATLTGAIRLPNGVILVTGLEGSVLTSRDGGFSVSSRRLRSREGISAAVPLAGTGALLIGEFGVRPFAVEE